MLRRRTLVAGFLFGPSPAAVAQTASLRLGTTPGGGGFAPYAVALVETLQSIDRGLELRPIGTSGSTDNVARLQAGSIDIGLVSAEVFDESESRAPGRLEIVSVMYYTPGMFAVLGNSRHRSISDLLGQPIVWQPRGTGSAVHARYVMDGLDLDRDFGAIYRSTHRRSEVHLRRQRRSALGQRAAAAELRADRRAPARRALHRARHGGDRPHPRRPFLPGAAHRATRHHPGQTEPIATIGSASFIVARPEPDEALVHRLAAAVPKTERFEGRPTYLAQTTVANTLLSVGSLAMSCTRGR